MDDLISRKALLNDYFNKWDGHVTSLPTLINSQPSVQQWIPCSKRLPNNERKAYWICLDTGGQGECRWTNNKYGLGESDTWGWSAMDIPMYTKVVAWMPLPEPYKG